MKNSVFPSGLEVGNFSQGALIAVLAIVMVFVILLVIILVTEGIGKLIENATKNEAVAETTTSAPVAAPVASYPLNIDDEDATVAALVASIDYRNETQKNIRVVSVKEVK